jgi:geranylgeranyl pyrophosphate synthase
VFNFAEKLSEKLGFINKSIEELDLSNIHSLLRDPTRYVVSGEGKRLRPIICTFCAEVVGGDYKETKAAFLALELIHSGTLVHDDIIDEDQFRRGNPSVQVKFGRKRAILTGDSLLSLGLKYAASTGMLSIVDWLSETALKMVQGVALQTFYRRKLVSETTYLNINYLKSGSLFEAAAAIGGLIGSRILDNSRRLAEFGKHFGNAYQIRDDICSLYAIKGDENLSRSDLLNGDVSLPFIYALESDGLSERDRKMMMSVYQAMTEKFDLDEIRRIFEETGALDRSIQKMKDFAERGRKCLEGFDRTEAKEFLNVLLDQYYKNFNPQMELKVVV